MYVWVLHTQLDKHILSNNTTIILSPTYVLTLERLSFNVFYVWLGMRYL